LGLWALLLAFGAPACGGKQDLTFVGAGASGGNGSGGKGSGGTNQIDPDCGDEAVGADEECDDGNNDDDDGCAAGCTVEDGWTCSGEPSVCTGCGNGVIEGDEECDDENGEDGDGCSADCAIEGSCTAPVVIALTDKANSLAGTVTSRTGGDETASIDAADCGGHDAGGGPARIFEFDLPNPADLVISVGSNFDVIVRLMSSPCDLETELPGTCADEGAIGVEETVSVNNAPAGKYYVVVEGKTSKQSGDFSVTVDASCPLDGLKIDRVILSEPFRTGLLNTNAACAIDLSRVGIYAQPEAADGPKTLPKILLEPHRRRVLTSESPPPVGTTYQGNIRYDLDDYAGAFYVCRGECDTASGSNVIDAFRWRGDAGAPSTPALDDVSFSGSLTALDDRVRKSYFRVAYDGVAPEFVAADFLGAYFVETFESQPLSGWVPPVALFYDATFEAVEGALGQHSLALTGGNPATAVWNGPKHRFQDNAGDPMSLEPTYVSLRVRALDKTLNHGWVFFGNQGTEGSGFGSIFRENGNLAFGSPTIAISKPYANETWYHIEYKNFVYPANTGAGTVEVFVDGVVQGAPLAKSTRAVSELNLRSLAETTFWIDQIIVQ
jgi:cysteine-rich repeat protein